MSHLIERSRGVQLRGNTRPRDVLLLEEMRERICDLESRLTAAKEWADNRDWYVPEAYRRVLRAILQGGA